LNTVSKPDRFSNAQAVVSDWSEKASNSPVLRGVKRVIIAVVGFTVLLVGLALLVLPGPAIVVIPTGLLILAMEFEWARRWLRRVREKLEASTSNGSDASANDRDEGLPQLIGGRVSSDNK
jgi:tellurite resistance protein TerC